VTSPFIRSLDSRLTQHASLSFPLLTLTLPYLTLPHLTSFTASSPRMLKPLSFGAWPPINVSEAESSEVRNTLPLHFTESSNAFQCSFVWRVSPPSSPQHDAKIKRPRRPPATECHGMPRLGPLELKHWNTVTPATPAPFSCNVPSAFSNIQTLRMHQQIAHTSKFRLARQSPTSKIGTRLKGAFSRHHRHHTSPMPLCAFLIRQIISAETNIEATRESGRLNLVSQDPFPISSSGLAWHESFEKFSRMSQARLRTRPLFSSFVTPRTRPITPRFSRVHLLTILAPNSKIRNPRVSRNQVTLFDV
jgi:hypothetical protein